MGLRVGSHLPGVCEHVFVSRLTGHPRGEADVGVDNGLDVVAHWSSRGADQGTTAVHALHAQGWSCPHCAVENPRSKSDAGEVVECDYCGRAFALELAETGPAPALLTIAAAPRAAAD
jgi:hypothetical protein